MAKHPGATPINPGDEFPADIHVSVKDDTGFVMLDWHLNPNRERQMPADAADKKYVIGALEELLKDLKKGSK